MLVYRRGSKFADNLTPRPGIDADGLSTFDSLERAADPGEKAQVIDTGKLRVLTAVPSEPPPGHVTLTLVPTEPKFLNEWAAIRGTGKVHPLTQDILDAIVDTVRRPKP
jgi:hypothetical protein